MTAILAPVTLADVERRGIGTTHGSYSHAAALGACDCLEEMGKHLEAAAGRAIEGARMVALVAESERDAFRAAVREWAAWEMTPDAIPRFESDDSANALDHLAAVSSGMR